MIWPLGVDQAIGVALAIPNLPMGVANATPKALEGGSAILKGQTHYLKKNGFGPWGWPIHTQGP
jgi:hypothetical protein